MSDSNHKQASRGPCVELRAWADDWLDDMLDAATQTRIEAHLGECSECNQYFAERRALAGDLLMLGRAADALVGATAPKAAPRVIRWRSWSIAAATVLFFLTAGLYISEFRRGGPASGLGGGEAQPTVEQTALPMGAPEPGSASGRDFDMTCPEGRLLVPMASSNPRIHIVWLYDQTVLHETPVDGQPVPQPASPG
jgi:hypothetical protein